MITDAMTGPRIPPSRFNRNPVRCSHEGTGMEILSPAVRIDADPQHTVPSAEAELARLRSQVAWLQAERAALYWAVGHDELTGLANRRLFHTLAPPLLREPARPAVVIVLDLNGFKPINDRFGHNTGDRVLCVVAQRLAHCVGDNVAARLGGDEFAAVLTSPHPHHVRQWWKPAVAALSAAIAEPVVVAGYTLVVTAAIGVAPARGDAQIAELLHDADQAMYQAKMSGSPYSVWSADAVNGAVPACQGQPTLGDSDRRREAISARRSDRGPATAVPSTTQGQAPPHGPRVVELAVVPSVQQKESAMSTPTCDPIRRDPADVAPASTYRRKDPVWVHRYGAWRPGVVEDASSRAVMATYRCAEGQGTVVDTMSAEYVLPRAEVDAQLDRTTSSSGVAA
jgi:diguanylate cyclase (GGDEF)-like protein